MGVPKCQPCVFNTDLHTLQGNDSLFVGLWNLLHLSKKGQGASGLWRHGAEAHAQDLGVSRQNSLFLTNACCDLPV